MSGLLELSGLTVAFGRRGARPVLDGVELSVGEGEIVGVIGETGSGKTTLARTAVGLVPARSGRVVFDGREISGLRGRALRAFRRSGRLSYAFQDPLRALDPELTVRRAVAEPLAVAGDLDGAEIAARVDEALETVGLDAARLGDRLPGAISGGQRQRVLLARAIVTRPRLLIADEPVSALDASNRNRVLRLLDRLRTERGMAVVVISHDLSSLAGIADRVAVLYRGRVVEQGPVREVFGRPLHPYTALLIASAPSVRAEGGPGAAALRPSAEPPAWTAREGCVFAHRCPFVIGSCRTAPASGPVGEGRTAACHRVPEWRGLVATAQGPPELVAAAGETHREAGRPPALSRASEKG
ncbi:ABC transporter ATP-binding protein [Streptomyces malaysiensis]|uniref:Dipeptide/oligopeptide/nickel ABC transporter ATP-binding protein n=1 Tax=Streptomyces autolyticus TaxID=75293 RepID=A0ABM6H7N9_9ACTN|nr:ABC transporter ATP-binding protein [Streptomyces autolyticus]AQA09886.1 dipeptide/oligopeptide/nickel ABC transporter ATP-binding protein [Streptomyces autolyticus]